MKIKGKNGLDLESEFLLRRQNFYINGNQLITISFYTFNIIVDTWGKKVYVEIG